MTKSTTTISPELKKSGMVTLVGRANVGKSTLLNTLVGTKLAITTPKPQTTRQVIQGVLNVPQGQAVFIDTPGYFQEKRSPITPKLNQKIIESLYDINLILYIVDPSRQIGPEERYMLSILRKTKSPKILVINKIDLPEKSLEFLEDYRSLGEDFDETVEVSALKHKHIKTLIERIFSYLPEGEPLYPPESITNMDEKFFISELIREKIFHTMGDEVPYTTAVEVESVEDKPDILVISAVILTVSPRYKKMLIGDHAKKIKEMGSTVRKELEIIMNRKVYLDLRVEVDKDWERKFE
ncbi:MAG TPA: GTPase Era [Candidatus Magasanikbacteria bacterium]|nr:GTPase Era [Candidatus Magasanikbacteria bacterium]